MQDGFHRREDRAWERVATLGLWVIAPHTKKKFTPAQLLGRARLQTLPPRPSVQAPDRASTTFTAEEDAARARVLAQALAWVKD